MAIPRPLGRFRQLLGNPGTYEVSAFVAPLLSLFPAAYGFWAKGEHRWAYFVGIGAIVQCLLGAGKAFTAWRKGHASGQVHELAGCLHTLHSIMVADWESKDRHGLRLTILVPVEDDHLQQVLDYVGDERVKRTAGRTFTARSGIAGKTLTDKQAYIAFRHNDKYEAYVKELISEWNYSEEAARALNPAAMAWLAIPLAGRDGRVEGILYGDSTERDFFTERRIQIALFACLGISVFIAKRYGD